MKNLLTSILFILQVTFVFAQQGPALKGQVVDAKTQQPILNAVLTIQNTSLSQFTKEDGTFSFETLPSENPVLLISFSGFKTQTFLLEYTAGQTLDLGKVALEEDIRAELQLSLITLTESDLGDNNTGSESTSGLLQSSRDVYQQTAAFNWGQARFRIRGLDNNYGTTMINGIVMNKISDGRPQWSNWGGLNDATRNQEFSMGSAPSDYSFGGLLGTQEINTRASFYRPGNRVTMSGTNTNYSWRMMGTHASGLNKDGWAFVVSGSRRWAQEGIFEGTDYAANSLFASVEKKINDKHSLNFTSIYAQNSRGKSSPNTQEVIDIKGPRYNSYWGYQDGKKRNSRDRDIAEPINMLSHYWKITENTSLQTNVAYQFGMSSNSRIDYQLGNNPDPTYYKNLPSYFLNDISNFDANGNNANAALALQNFTSDGQINWNSMYSANQSSVNPGRSVYALYEDRNDDKQLSANSILNAALSSNIKLNAGVNFRQLRSHNFQNLIDLMGGEYFEDKDLFFNGDAAQSDLNNPNRRVGENEAYGYNYKLMANVIDAYTQFLFTYNKVDFYLAQNFTRTQYQRDGLYRNGIYANNSFGKSEKINFENFGFKGGLTYKITGRHLLDFNALYMTKAPVLRNAFSNARLNNNITTNLDSENIVGVDGSYIIRTPKFKARITGFFNKITNATEVSFYYGEGIGEAEAEKDNEDSFISEIVKGIDKQSIGGEFGVEYNLTSTIKLNAAASYGQYIYSDNAVLSTNDDNRAAKGLNPVRNFGTAYIKDYKQAGVPQQAFSFGIEYRDPKFWWIGANANYLGDSYLDVSNIMRTKNFVVAPDGLGYEGATDESVRSLLKQEKFDNFMLFNVVGGKSWRISKKNRNTVGFFASINNVLDETYKTGGFEQSRKAIYPDLKADQANGTPSFGSKYFYGYGRTYFVNFYLNF